MAGAKGELDAVRGDEAGGLGVMVRFGMDGIYDAAIKNVRLGKIVIEMPKYYKGLKAHRFCNTAIMQFAA